MRTRTWTNLTLSAIFLALPSLAGGDVASDRAAAILIFPRVRATIAIVENLSDVTTFVTDTVIQISNTSNEPVTLQCFYVNANSRCSISESVCGPIGSEDSAIREIGVGSSPCPLDGELCLPGWTETDFRIYLTARQPIAWRATTGLAREQFPLDGTAFVGPTGQSNAGSAVPPVTLEPMLVPEPTNLVELTLFTGELKCVVVDEQGRGVARNAVKGEATLVTSVGVDNVDDDGVRNFVEAEKHNAIGIQGIGGDVNGDGILELGGDAGEYNGCPSVLIADHFFDSRPILNGGMLSSLTLLPCSQDLRAQIPGATTAQFLVFNEFEQRFSTSVPVACYFNRFLSFIDTRDPSRSIFSTGVAGTVVGQTRIRGVSSGLLGILAEEPERTFAAAGASGNLHFQGERTTADRLVLP
jgi:hypothetical protein